jgi:hypothetical protein
MLIDLALINIESRANVEVWVRKTRRGISTTQPDGPLTTVKDLPPLERQDAHEFAWDGVEGLYVRPLSNGSSAADRGALRLVNGADDGRHRLGIRFRLPEGEGLYRVTAVLGSTDDVHPYLELRDENARHYGMAIYAIRRTSVLRTRRASVLRTHGNVRKAGVTLIGDGRVKVWLELACDGESGAGYVGFASSTGAVSYQGDGRSSLQFFGLEIAQRGSWLDVLRRWGRDRNRAA